MEVMHFVCLANSTRMTATTTATNVVEMLQVHVQCFVKAMSGAISNSDLFPISKE